MNNRRIWDISIYFFNDGLMSVFIRRHKGQLNSLFCTVYESGQQKRAWGKRYVSQLWFNRFVQLALRNSTVVHTERKVTGNVAIVIRIGG